MKARTESYFQLFCTAVRRQEAQEFWNCWGKKKKQPDWLLCAFNKSYNVTEDRKQEETVFCFPRINHYGLPDKSFQALAQKTIKKIY